jgi:GWxTD domain-containing protein
VTAALLLVVGLHSPALSERDRVFLEDVAHFLLTPEQRDRFVALETDASRTRFIESFWSVRDLSEHEARLRACDRLFGARGRWSVRGRIYQWLGAPSYREDLTRAGNRLVPTELWHYTGPVSSYLPDTFYLIFFQPGGSGEFRLWSPESDGIVSLMPASEPNRYLMGAETTLEQIDPELALAVEGLVPGGARREALSLLTSLEALPELTERERTYGTDVHVTVSTRELTSRLVASVWLDDAGVPELHYALELAPGASTDLQWREEEANRHRIRFTLVGRLVGRGVERERWEDSLELDVSDAEKRALVKTRLVFTGRRLVHSSDERLELALVTDGASAVVATTLAPGSEEVNDNTARAVSFRSELQLSSAPARVLDRSRTPSEEARYRFARGVSLARRGSTERAITELEASLKLDADELRTHLELGRLLYASRRYRDVLRRLGAVEERFGDEPDVFVLMAGAAQALGRHDDAITYYEKARTLAPESEAVRDALEAARRRSP